MSDEPKQQDSQNDRSERSSHDDDFEIRANLKGVSVRAGNGWKKYLGPWLGPIVLVAVFGAAVALIITAFFAVRMVSP